MKVLNQQQIFYHLQQSVFDGWGGAVLNPTQVYNKLGGGLPHTYTYHLFSSRTVGFFSLGEIVSRFIL